MKESRNETIQKLQTAITILKRENALLMKENQLVMKQNEFYFRRNKIQLARIANLTALFDANELKDEDQIDSNEILIDEDDTIEESDPNFMKEIELLTASDASDAPRDLSSDRNDETLIQNKAGSMQNKETLLKNNDPLNKDNEFVIAGRVKQGPQKDETANLHDTVKSDQIGANNNSETLKDIKELMNKDNEIIDLNQNSPDISQSDRTGMQNGDERKTDTMKVSQDTVKSKYETANYGNDTIKKFRDTIDYTEDTIRVIMERLKASLRTKYSLTMTKRWSHELIFFSKNGRASTEAIMNTLQISRATLMRDMSLFKNKKWIKYTGTKKNGYYVMTEEGLAFMMRRESE